MDLMIVQKEIHDAVWNVLSRNEGSSITRDLSIGMTHSIAIDVVKKLADLSKHSMNQSQ